MCRPSAAGIHWVMAAPSSRTQPPAAGQTPTIARTRDDLPEPLGPAIASALPALSLKLAPRTTGLWAPGGVTLNPSIASTWAGAGSSSRAAGAGIAENRSSSRRQPWRAATKPFQLAIATSIGAKARPVRIELEIDRKSVG